MSNQPSAASAPPGYLTDNPFTRGMGASAVLGMELVHEETGRTRMRVGYRDELARSVTRPVLHAGAIVTAIDSVMGMTGMRFMQAHDGAHSGIATLDFRYDEFESPAERCGVLVEAHCERLDGDVLYVTGSCSSLDGSRVHGRAIGRFVRTAAHSVPTPAAFGAANSGRNAVAGTE